MDALVAVIITCYNEGAYIGAAVRSVLDQTRAELVGEIIIADDGSDEPTLAVLRDIATWDPRIRVLYGSGGARQAAQRNLGVRSTQLPLIAFLDGDDMWQPQKLEAQLDLLDAGGTAGLVYTGFSTFADGKHQHPLQAPIADLSAQSNLALAYFLNDPPIMPSTVLMKRDIYLDHDGMDPAILCFEETEFYLRLARTTRFQCVPTPLVLKRNRSSSITGGRKDLMAWHAFVAFKAAADNPALLPHVPRRLAERARKLGNQRFLLNDRAQARALSSLACRLQPLSTKNWLGWLLPRLPGTLADLLLKTALKSRAEALGGADER
ncbi:MAG: glycosyltransferase family 2 protein [Sphingobium sp.]